MLPFELTKDTPYLALSGELWSVFYEYFNKNWPCYKGFLLYSLQIIRWYIWPQPGRNPALVCFRPDSDTSSGDVDRGSHTLGLTLSKWTEYSSVSSFTKHVNPRLVKRPLKINGRLANRKLTSLVKEATVSGQLTSRDVVWRLHATTRKWFVEQKLT